MKAGNIKLEIARVKKELHKS